MTTGVVVLEGTLRPADEAVVSVFDRGFLYGDGVFESLRTYERTPYLLRDHVERLFASARTLRIEPPVSRAALEQETLQAIERVDGPGDLYVRLMITRGRGPLGLTHVASRPTRVVLVVPLDAPDPATYQRGIALATTRAQPALRGTSAASAKTIRYLASVLASLEARAQESDEALFLDEEGLALECAAANVFGVLHDVVVTPPVSRGILPGLTRRRVLELCLEIGIPCEERAFAPSDPRLTEAFVTSSLREVLPATRIDGRAVGTGAPGAVTARIHKAFRRALPGCPSSWLGA
jgi:branched-chain amino acid aminotransferase